MDLQWKLCRPSFVTDGHFILVYTRQFPCEKSHGSLVY